MKIKALMKEKKKHTSGIGFTNTCRDILRFKVSPNVDIFRFSLVSRKTT